MYTCVEYINKVCSEEKKNHTNTVKKKKGGGAGTTGIKVFKRALKINLEHN